MLTRHMIFVHGARPTIAVAIALGGVLGTDAVTATNDLGNGPLYGMIGVLGVAVLALVGQIAKAVVDWRRTVPETPDVTAKLTPLIADIAALRQMVIDDRVNVTERMDTMQEVLDAKIASNRHEQKNANTRIELILHDIQRHVRPWPNVRQGDEP